MKLWKLFPLRKIDENWSDKNWLQAVWIWNMRKDNTSMERVQFDPNDEMKDYCWKVLFQKIKHDGGSCK